MVRVLAFGAFDLLHPGHTYYLKSAKKLGDELFVIIARNSTVEKVKGKYPKFDEKKRLKQVQKVDYVDKVVLGNKKDKLKVIEDIKPDIIALGYDQDSFTDRLEEKLKERKLKVKIVRIGSFKPHIYKSSLLKKK